MRLNLLKLFLTYLTLFVLLCTTFHKADAAQMRKSSIEDFNVRGNYATRPVLGDCYYSSRYYPGDFPSLWIQLMAFERDRKSAFDEMAKTVQVEEEKLKSEHQRLLLERDGKNLIDRDPESAWSLEFTRNIANQSQLRSKLEYKRAKWDAENWLVVGYEKHGSKNYLTLVRFVRSQDKLAVPAVAVTR